MLVESDLVISVMTCIPKRSKHLKIKTVKINVILFQLVVMLLKMTSGVVPAHLHKLLPKLFASGHTHIESKQSL